MAGVQMAGTAGTGPARAGAPRWGPGGRAPRRMPAAASWRATSFVGGSSPW